MQQSADEVKTTIQQIYYEICINTVRKEKLKLEDLKQENEL